MRTKTLGIIAMAAGLTAAPGLSLAAKATAATDSCLNAFLASLSATMQKTPKLRAAHFYDYDDSIGNSSGVWTLTAHDATDHHVIARMQCTVTASGRVLELHREPL